MGRRLSEIAEVEIINVFDGGKYGCIGDCEMMFDKGTGEILSIMVEGERSGFFLLGSSERNHGHGRIELKWSDKMKLCEKTLIFDSKI